MKTRRAKVGLLINKQNVSNALLEEMTSFTYTDPASGEADSLNISFEDRERKWCTYYAPKKNDLIAGAIHLYNYEHDGSYRGFECGGAFFVDKFGFSGHPNTMNLSAISTPINKQFKETKRTKTYNDITIQGIAAEIANRNNLKLEFVAADVSIRVIEQNKETDANFITKICNNYGLQIKIYTEKLIIFDREEYKKVAAVKTYNKEDIDSYSWDTQIEGSYEGGIYTYTDSITGAEIKASYGNTEGRVLNESGKADSEADAIRIIKSKVLNANHSITTMSISVMGTGDLYSTQCIEIKGMGAMDGKYYIDKITHSVSGGYTMNLNLARVE